MNKPYREPMQPAAPRTAGERRRLARLQGKAEQAVERLLALLDELGADPDLEDGADDEAEEEDQNLGSTHGINQGRTWQNAPGWLATDGEPTFASTRQEDTTGFYVAAATSASKSTRAAMITTRGDRQNGLAWRPLMAQYLAARRCHEEADRVLNRVSRLAWKHLIKRPGMTDERAYELAGIDMADKRMIRASIAKQKALDQVKAALRGADYGTRLQAVGWALCDAIRPGKVANENRKGRAA